MAVTTEGDYRDRYETIAHIVDAAPDPRPAIRLRQALARDRELGRTFDEVWDKDLVLALRGVQGGDEWHAIFWQTRAAWQAEYERNSDCPPSLPGPDPLTSDPECLNSTKFCRASSLRARRPTSSAR